MQAFAVVSHDVHRIGVASELTTFGERLREARDEAGLTQHALAERIGVRHLTISRYERSITKLPPAKRVVELAKALGVSFDWLMGESKPEAPADPSKDPPALTEFLATPLGQSATAEERQKLRTRVQFARPSAKGYMFALLAFREEV